MTIRTCVAGAAVTALLAFAPAAMAGSSSSQGSTTGPAAGSNVQPSTAVQKDNPAAQGNTGSSGSGQSAAGAVGAGAPGTAAKGGTEGGPSPKPEGPSDAKK